MNQILAVFGSMNIENKTVLVTVSTDGVGRLVARRLADQGPRVLLHGPVRSRGHRSLTGTRAAHRGSRAYAQSNLAQIMFTFDLARELEPDTVTANCLHPATYMATTMVRQSGVTPISTVEEGAEAILNLAVADELDGCSGQFSNGLRPSKPNPQAYDDAARERLRVLSLRLTGLA